MQGGDDCQRPHVHNIEYMVNVCPGGFVALLCLTKVARGGGVCNVHTVHTPCKNVALVLGGVPFETLIFLYRGGGGFRYGNISPWEISYFKCVRNFPLNFQATVRNKPGAKFSHDA